MRVSSSTTSRRMNGDLSRPAMRQEQRVQPRSERKGRYFLRRLRRGDGGGLGSELIRVTAGHTSRMKAEHATGWSKGLKKYQRGRRSAPCRFVSSADMSLSPWRKLSACSRRLRGTRNSDSCNSGSLPQGAIICSLRNSSAGPRRRFLVELVGFDRPRGKAERVEVTSIAECVTCAPAAGHV